MESRVEPGRSPGQDRTVLTATLGRPAPRGLIGPAAGAPATPRPQIRRAIAPNATVVSRIDVTRSIALYRVRADETVPPFEAGQYFALGLDVDGRFLQRPYSTASAVGTAQELEFLIRLVPGGAFTTQLWNVRPGDRIWMGPPKGLFTLRHGDRRTHLFISTGTGLAPFMSMTDALLRSDPGSSIVLLHGASHASELAYRDRLENWAADGRINYVPTISRPADPANTGWSGATGRVETVVPQVCRMFDLRPLETVAYLCGNPDMIEAASVELAGVGFAQEAIIREHYWTSSEAR